MNIEYSWHEFIKFNLAYIWYQRVFCTLPYCMIKLWLETDSLCIGFKRENIAILLFGIGNYDAIYLF